MKSERGLVGTYIIIAITMIILIAIIAIVIFVVCNDINYGTKQGTIIDKRYNAPYTSYISSEVGNSVIRTPQYYPETYQLKLQKQDDGKVKECWIQVPAKEYENYKVGDYYGK